MTGETATDSRDDTQVSKEMKRLETEITMLSDIVRTLTKKLERVLTPVEKDESPNPPQPGGLVPHAQHINNQALRIFEINEDLRGLNGRLEI